MAVALFIPSFSTTTAGQLHCQAVIELSFSAPAQEDSSSDELVTFTTKEGYKTGIFTHRVGLWIFPSRPQTLSSSHKMCFPFHGLTA